MIAAGWRTRQIARLGENRWKAIYALASLAGLVLTVWGYGLTRAVPDWWSPPAWTRAVALLLMIPSFVLLTAAFVSGNHFKTALGHPMVAGVMIWALAHLIANGRPGDLLLFGAFFAWTIVAFIAARRRDRAAGTGYPPGTLSGNLRATAIGFIAWALFVYYGHQWLIGVRVIG